MSLHIQSAKAFVVRLARSRQTLLVILDARAAIYHDERRRPCTLHIRVNNIILNFNQLTQSHLLHLCAHCFLCERDVATWTKYDFPCHVTTKFHSLYERIHQGKLGKDSQLLRGPVGAPHFKFRTLPEHKI